MTISNNKHLRTDLGVSVATHGAHVVHLFLVPDPIKHQVVNGVVTLCMHMPIQQKVNLHVYSKSLIMLLIHQLKKITKRQTAYLY